MVVSLALTKMSGLDSAVQPKWGGISSDGDVIETVYAINRAGCGVQCLLSDNCVAASFLRAADEDELNCQLHGAGVESEDHLNNHTNKDYLITKANPNTG